MICRECGGRAGVHLDWCNGDLTLLYSKVTCALDAWHSTGRWDYLDAAHEALTELLWRASQVER